MQSLTCNSSTSPDSEPKRPARENEVRVIVTAGASLSRGERDPAPTTMVDVNGWNAIVGQLSRSEASGAECLRYLLRAFAAAEPQGANSLTAPDLRSIGIRLKAAGLGVHHSTSEPVSDLREAIIRVANAVEANGVMILQVRGENDRNCFVSVKQVVRDPGTPQEAILHMVRPGTQDETIAVSASTIEPSLMYRDGIHVDGVHAFTDGALMRESRVNRVVARVSSEHPWLTSIPGVTKVVALLAAHADYRGRPWRQE